jgi:hypothetical protein
VLAADVDGGHGLGEEVVEEVGVHGGGVILDGCTVTGWVGRVKGFVWVRGGRDGETQRRRDEVGREEGRGKTPHPGPLPVGTGRGRGT